MSKIDWYSRIKKEMGDHVMMARDTPDVLKTLYKSSSPSLNWALGGGIAAGKVFTVYGPESAGKSLVGFDFIIQLQKSDPEAYALLYDAEYSFNKEYFAKMGGNIDRLIVAPTNKPEEIFDHFYEVVWPMMQDGLPLAMTMIDSIKSIRGPKEAATTSVTDHVMADLPVLISKASRKWMEPIRKHGVATILVQQVNMEMDPNLVKYQNKKWNVPNGQALKHWSDYMLLVERIEKKDAKLFDKEHSTLVESNKDGIQVGHMVRCKVEKNKVAPPYRIAEFTVQYGKGIVNAYQELAELGMALKVVSNPKQGTYVFGDVQVRGRDAFIAEVKNSKELQRQLEVAIGTAMNTDLTFDSSEVKIPDAQEDFTVFTGELLGTEDA